MNREIYALQLIDEETGEVLKDVTPITESISVIHNGEKLNEVLDFQRDKIEEQSKSNLVLVTTMQKLLSEKIEELEREKLVIENNPVKNIVQTHRTNYWKNPGNEVEESGGIIFGHKGTVDEVNFGFDQRNIMTMSGGIMAADNVYFVFKTYNNVDDLRLHVSDMSGSYQQYEKKIVSDDGVYYFWQKLANKDMDSITSVLASKTDILLLDNSHMISLEEPSFFIDNLTRSKVQEELDFYKFQLEKLKLTQEVDLNLLLTL